MCKLERALKEAQLLGIEGDCICLIASSDALGGLIETRLNQADDKTSLKLPQVVLSNSDANHNQAISTSPQGPNPYNLKPDLVANFKNWITPAMAKNLQHHLVLGAGLLFLFISTTLQETGVSEVLLAYSSDRVQFHDI